MVELESGKSTMKGSELLSVVAGREGVGGSFGCGGVSKADCQLR